MHKSTLTHLRLPFSLFLLPVFLFALSQSVNVNTKNSWIVFLLLHVFLYPASNAYNSYYDKDEGSIGGIKNPPPVTKELLITAWVLDAMAIVIALLTGLNWFFVVYLLVYGGISKAYSHPAIRLKQYPVLSLLTVSIFQGFFTYLAVYQTISPVAITSLLSREVLLPAVITTTNLLAVYPITQIYQHDEDAKHGDLTFSRLVGIQGTFLNAAIFFSLSFAGFVVHFLAKSQPNQLFLLGVCMTPVLFFFLMWWYKSRQSPALANFSNTMYMNIIASLSLNIFFGLLCIHRF